jgi:OOP family OmpA-OmpF porin
MKTKNALVGAVFAVGAAAMSSAALAQQMRDTGLYIGGSFGQSTADIDCGGTTSCDDSDTSWKVFGGYQVNRNFALEVGYGALGEVTASTPAFFVGPTLIPAADVKIKTTAWEVVGIGSLPLGERFSLFGKVGLYVADTDIEVVFAGLGTATDADDNVDLTFGFGARYDFTRNFGVRAEWQRYGDVKAGDFDKFDVDVMSVGIVFRFQ